MFCDTHKEPRVFCSVENGFAVTRVLEAVRSLLLILRAFLNISGILGSKEE